MQATLSADALGHGRPVSSTGEGSGSAGCLLSVGGSDTGGLQPGSSGAPRRRRHGARRSPQHTILQFRYYFRNLRELVVPWTGRQSLSGQAPLYLADDWRLVSDSTRGALCAQLTFRLAWCRQHSAVMATELLQPRDLACGTLFQSSCVIPTSPSLRTVPTTAEGTPFDNRYSPRNTAAAINKQKQQTGLHTCISFA